jgi:indolepyruvate ferredoxin oxidoreductase alpha subunit
MLARAAHAPVLDPSDSEECRDFVKAAYEISEKYDTPVVVRLTTRTAHARTLVEPGPRVEPPVREYEKNMPKYVSMPGNMIKRHLALEEQENRLKADANGMTRLNRILWNDTKLGVITSGAAYNYVREALPEASVLKLGLAWPLPEQTIRDFAAKVEKLVVIEDMEPFYEDAIRAMGIPCSGKELTGVQGELFAAKIAEKFAGAPKAEPAATEGIPLRPPVLCPGCPHRAMYYVLHKLKLHVLADIGCYTLGALPPLSAVDTTICMGASIPMAHGMEKARGTAKDTVAVIGDSTFCHSGITGLLNMAYNRAAGTVIIADNSITGMTGHQNNPANGKDVYGNPAPKLDLIKLCGAMGITNVTVADPFDIPEFEKVVRAETARDALSVIIAKHPCALVEKKNAKPFTCDANQCRNCGACRKLGCPAILQDEKHVRIDATQCVGCGMCAAVCPFGALKGA